MYFPFFILHDWGKRSDEARSSHCAVLPILYRNFCKLQPKPPERVSFRG